jgi:hypothetical protein
MMYEGNLLRQKAVGAGAAHALDQQHVELAQQWPRLPHIRRAAARKRRVCRSACGRSPAGAAHAAAKSLHGRALPDALALGDYKRHFLRHLYIKTDILPRQAGDKHREGTQKDRFSSGRAAGLLRQSQYHVATCGDEGGGAAVLWIDLQ